jgi:23S rRNA maturation mini-RNase III
MDETKKPITKQDLQAAILKETVKLVEEQREEILRRAKKNLAEQQGK